MSDDKRTPLMQTPARGMKQVRPVGDPTWNGPEFDRMDNSDRFWEAVRAFFLGPFLGVAEIMNWSVLFTLVCIFLSSFIYGAVYVFIEFSATSPATDIFTASVFFGAVSAAAYILPSLWTYYDNMPTIIMPAHALSMPIIAITKERRYTYGLILAILYVGAMMGGYASAGGALVAFGVTGVFQNAAINGGQTYVMYWFSASIICFSFLYNHLFLQSENEAKVPNHMRAVLSVAVALFLFTTGFWRLGLTSYNSGLYLTQIIVAKSVFPTVAGDPLAAGQAAFYFCVDLLAVPVTAWLLTLAFGGIVWAQKNLDQRRAGRFPESDQKALLYADSPVPMANTVAPASSARLRNRTNVVNY